MQIKPVMSCREEVPEPDSFFLGSGRCELMFEISSVIKSDSVPYAAVRAEATSGVQAEPRPSSSVQNGGAHHRVMLGLRAIVDVTFCKSGRRPDRLQIRLESLLTTMASVAISFLRCSVKSAGNKSLAAGEMVTKPFSGSDETIARNRRFNPPAVLAPWFKDRWAAK